MREDDELINVLVTNGEQGLIIGTHDGYAMAFDENDARVMGRTATGVRGIRLREGDFVVGAAVLNEDSEVLVVTENGYGKRTVASEYTLKKRGGKGVKTSNISEKSGKLAGILAIESLEEDLMLMTDQGVVIRISVESISQSSRATLGVRMIRLDDGAIVSSITKLIKSEGEEAAEALNDEADLDEAADEEEEE